jgi:hypothetical protein
MYALGSAARLVLIASGEFGYLENAESAVTSASAMSQPLSALEQFTRYGLILAAIDAYVLSRSHRTRATLWGLLSVELAFALFSAVKASYVFTFFSVVVVASLARGRVPRVIVVVAITGTLILIPLNGAYRQYIRTSGEGITADTALTALPRVLAVTLEEANPLSLARSSYGKAAQRFREIDNLAVIMEKTPTIIPYRGPFELVIGPLRGLVPRFLWSEKPLLTTGYEFTQEYWELPPSLITSTAVTIPGDLYRHFGWIALVAGMFLVGTVARLVRNVYDPAVDIRRCLLYIPIFILFLNVEIDMQSFVTSVIQLLVIQTLVTKLAFGSTRIS